MTEEEFKTHINAVIATKLQRYQKLSEQVKDNWEEIVTYTFQFNRRIAYAEELKKISKVDLIQFYKDKLLPSLLRRKLSVQIFGVNAVIPDAIAEENAVYIPVGGESEFKSNMFFYPARNGSKL